MAKWNYDAQVILFPKNYFCCYRVVTFQSIFIGILRNYIWLFARWRNNINVSDNRWFLSAMNVWRNCYKSSSQSQNKFPICSQSLRYLASTNDCKLLSEKLSLPKNNKFNCVALLSTQNCRKRTFSLHICKNFRLYLDNILEKLLSFSIPLLGKVILNVFTIRGICQSMARFKSEPVQFKFTNAESFKCAKPVRYLTNQNIFFGFCRRFAIHHCAKSRRWERHE